MSNTRHAGPSRALSQERYMSSPEYSELRGISGNAVTAKAALMAHPDKRSLLFFLQAVSLRPGGLKKFCRDFLATFPERIGSPTMHREGIKPGGKYGQATARKIASEIGRKTKAQWQDEQERQALFDKISGEEFLLRDPDEPPYVRPKVESKKLPPQPVDEFIELCRDALAGLEGFIIELCINPKLQFSAPGESAKSLEGERRALEDNFPEVHRSDMGLANESNYQSAEHPCFKIIVGALFEYKDSYEQAARCDYVMTEVGRMTFETLDVALETGKMTVVQGNSGIGKTTATEAWCNMHLGEARLISLSGITHKTGFFRALARVLGIGGSYARSSTEMQTRIEDMLQRSRLVLVIDEAHHLFSAAERVYSRPELVDWINTALYNHGVPASLICTPQFAVRMARVEKQTTWNSDQLRRRVKRFCELTAAPRSEDLTDVAKKLLPDADADTVKYVVGYALTHKLHMPAIVDAVDEARLLVKREGRDKITFADVDRAIGEYCSKSSEAMTRSFSADIIGKRPGSKRRRGAAAPDPEPHLNREGLPLHAPARPGRTTNLTGLAPVATPTAKRQVNVMDADAVEV